MQQFPILSRICEPLIKNPTFYQQLRATHILKRKHVAPLTSCHRVPELRSKYKIYEPIQDHDAEKEPRIVQLLLTKYVGDLGRAGDLVDVEDKRARFLLLSLKAAYPSPENLARFKKDTSDTFSSKYAGATASDLSKFILNICMNKEEPWTLEPWHVRVGFRRAHINVPEYAITMPKKEVKGPDLSIEGKDFFVTVKINNKETAVVRCRIHHWATEISDRLPIDKSHLEKKSGYLFPEDEALDNAPPP